MMRPSGMVLAVCAGLVGCGVPAYEATPQVRNTPERGLVRRIAFELDCPETDVNIACAADVELYYCDTVLVRACGRRAVYLRRSGGVWSLDSLDGQKPGHGGDYGPSKLRP